MGLFTKLANEHLTGTELGSRLKLHPRGIADFYYVSMHYRFVSSTFHLSRRLPVVSGAKQITTMPNA
jgi:hypothetical protein